MQEVWRGSSQRARTSPAARSIETPRRSASTRPTSTGSRPGRGADRHPRSERGDRTIVPARVRRSVAPAPGGPGRPAAPDTGRRRRAGRPARRADAGPRAVPVHRRRGRVALPGGTDHAGEGVLVANIDTGIWPESPMLEDKGLATPPGSYGCQFGLSGDVNDPVFGCNNKVVGAYAFTTPTPPSSARCQVSSASTPPDRARGCARRGTPTGTGPTRSRPRRATSSRALRCSRWIADRRAAWHPAPG